MESAALTQEALGITVVAIAATALFVLVEQNLDCFFLIHEMVAVIAGIFVVLNIFLRTAPQSLNSTKPRGCFFFRELAHVSLEPDPPPHLRPHVLFYTSFGVLRSFPAGSGQDLFTGQLLTPSTLRIIIQQSLQRCCCTLQKKKKEKKRPRRESIWK